MSTPTAEQRLRALVEALDRASESEMREAGRVVGERLRAQFQSEYRALAYECRCRYGKEPTQTQDEYVDRRFAEVLR